MQALNILLLASLPIILYTIYAKNFFKPSSLDSTQINPNLQPLDLIIAYFMMVFCVLSTRDYLHTLPEFNILKNTGQNKLPQASDYISATFNLYTALAQALPASIFIIWKAHYNTEIKNPLGFSLKKPLKQLKAVIITCGIAIPIVLATLALISMVVKFLVVTPDDLIAHDSLNFLTQTKDQTALIYTLIGAILIAPIHEEILYRGLVQNIVKKSLANNHFITIAITSTLFTFMHIGTAPDPTQYLSTLPALFIFSCILGYSYYKSNSLYVPIFTHMAFNAVNVALAFAQTTPAS